MAQDSGLMDLSCMCGSDMMAQGRGLMDFSCMCG